MTLLVPGSTTEVDVETLFRRRLSPLGSNTEAQCLRDHR
jgi:hypothetical protein